MSSGEESLLPDFPKGLFPLERLTGAQRQVMSALAAGYTVCRAVGSSVPDASCVLIGNGTRLARVTVGSLEYRELIEVASIEDDPNRRWNRIIFYRLSKRGWYEAVRQKLQFAANEVEIVLPIRVSEIHAAIERYVNQYQVEAFVEVKGTRFEYVRGQRLREVTIPKWAAVVAFDEGKNALGLGQGKPGEIQLQVEWVDLRYFTTGKLRLSPLREHTS